MVSECFQNTPNTSRMLTSNALRMLSECFQNTANRPRMDRTLSVCFPHSFRIILKTFGKHSSCYMSIRGVRKAYGTQHVQIFIPNALRTRRMLPERFPYIPYAPRVCCTLGWSLKIILNMHNRFFGATECRSVCTRTEPNSQYAPRTHRMLPEYDPFAPPNTQISIWKTNGMVIGLLAIVNYAAILTLVNIIMQAVTYRRSLVRQAYDVDDQILGNVLQVSRSSSVVRYM